MAEVTLEQIAQMMIERKARDIAFYEEHTRSLARIEVELAIIKRNTVAIMAEDVSESSYAYRAR